jgi:hypothetical protein
MAQYPIPPWLNVSPSDFGQAAARGAEISLGRQRLQQEGAIANMRAAQAQQEMAARREQEQQNAQREEQQLAYQHEYQQAEIGLKQQQQEQSEQQFQMDVKAAAAKSQVMQAAQAELDAGGDPSKVWMKYGPLLGMTGSSLSALTKPPVDLNKVTPITLSDGRKVDSIRTGTGSVRIIMPPPNVSTNAPQAVPVIGPNGEEVPGMIGIPGPGGMRIHNVPKETPYEATQKKINARMAGLGQPTTATATSKPATIPPAAIEHLKRFPDTAPQFDAKYGKGESAKILKQQAAPGLEPDYSE